MNRECAACGCVRPARCRGWCQKHYVRWRKHGDPETKLPGHAGGTEPTNEIGNRYGRLVVIELAPKQSDRAAWICLCDCGGRVVPSGKDLRAGNVNSCGCLRVDAIRRTHLLNVKEIVGYKGAHSRVNRARGKASDNPCVDCGLPAFQWSYDHSDPNELRSEWGPYSTDPTRYVPCCRSCQGIGGQNIIELTGQRFGRLFVTGRSDKPGTYWCCVCDCGNSLEVIRSSLRGARTLSCGCLQKERMAEIQRSRRGDDFGYAQAHVRVVEVHGKAATHACVDCGGPAAEWSYDHADPDEHLSLEGRPFSRDIARYQPRCKSCHRTLDRNHKRMAPK